MDDVDGCSGGGCVRDRFLNRVNGVGLHRAGIAQVHERTHLLPRGGREQLVDLLARCLRQVRDAEAEPERPFLQTLQ